jgi:regulator of cell morphogenesis and NO signaling
MRVFNQTISSIVDENYIYARALSYLGIDFYRHPHRKLGELCKEMGLVEEKVIRSFYLFDRNYRLSFKELNNYPLPLIIQYLKHTHSVFIKEKLPYVARLIENQDHNGDLKLIFPDFIEEFIQHIHQEEDTVFGYIEKLLFVEKGLAPNPISALWKYRNESLKRIHSEHQNEDELAGIRGIVDEVLASDLHWKVIANEIRAFDREMMYHAQIENEILFPKALALEERVKRNIDILRDLN